MLLIARIGFFFFFFFFFFLRGGGCFFFVRLVFFFFFLLLVFFVFFFWAKTPALSSFTRPVAGRPVVYVRGVILSFLRTVQVNHLPVSGTARLNISSFSFPSGSSFLQPVPFFPRKNGLPPPLIQKDDFPFSLRNMPSPVGNAPLGTPGSSFPRHSPPFLS